MARRAAIFRGRFAFLKFMERFRGGFLITLPMFPLHCHTYIDRLRPVSVTLGMSHSIVLLRNMEYIPPPPPPPPPAVAEPEPKPVVEESPDLIAAVMPVASKPPAIVTEERDEVVVTEKSPVVRGVRELLQLHQNKDDTDKYTTTTSPYIIPDVMKLYM